MTNPFFYGRGKGRPIETIGLQRLAAEVPVPFEGRDRETRHPCRNLAGEFVFRDVEIGHGRKRGNRVEGASEGIGLEAKSQQERQLSQLGHRDFAMEIVVRKVKTVEPPESGYSDRECSGEEVLTEVKMP